MKRWANSKKNALIERRVDERDNKKNIQKWQCVKSETVFEHPRMTLVEDDVRLPNGKVVKYLRHAKQGRQGVTMVCIVGGNILLQREYSYPIDEVIYQFPGGKVEEGEPYEAAGRRELVEESGFEALETEYMGWYYLDNRRTDAKMHVVLVSEAKEVARQGGDLEEDIENEWMPLQDFQAKIKAGEIINYSVLAAWALVSSKARV